MTGFPHYCNIFKVYLYLSSIIISLVFFVVVVDIVEQGQRYTTFRLFGLIPVFQNRRLGCSHFPPTWRMLLMLLGGLLLKCFHLSWRYTHQEFPLLGDMWSLLLISLLKKMPKMWLIFHSNHQCTEFQFPHFANVCYHYIYNYSALWAWRSVLLWLNLHFQITTDTTVFCGF